MKLLTIEIQDGENTYYEYYLLKENEHYSVEDYADGFLRVVKSAYTKKITKEEIKVLKKFGVV